MVNMVNTQNRTKTSQKRSKKVKNCQNGHGVRMSTMVLGRSTVLLGRSTMVLGMFTRVLGRSTILVYSRETMDLDFQEMVREEQVRGSLPVAGLSFNNFLLYNA